MSKSDAFTQRFVVVRVDGSEPHPDDRFVAVNYGRDPAAAPALEVLADEYAARYSAFGFAADLRSAIADPTKGPPQTAPKTVYVFSINDLTLVKAADSFQAAVALAGFAGATEIEFVAEFPTASIFTADPE